MNGLIGIVVSLAVIIFLLKRGWSLGPVMFLGAPIVALFNWFSLQQNLDLLVKAVTSPVTVNLLLAVLGVGLLSEMLSFTGSIDRALLSLRAIIKDRRWLIPASSGLIGLLPIPGGAFLSAPLVKEVGRDINLPVHLMALSNIFYRHLFYFFFPLYPGVIAMVEMSGISRFSLMIFTIVPMIAALIFSFYYIFRGVDKDLIKGETTSSRGESFLNFGISLSPVFITLVFSLVLGWPFPLGLLAGIISAFFLYLPPSGRAVELKKRAKHFHRGIKTNVLLAILGVMIFKEFIEFSGALPPLAERLLEMGVPVVLIAFIFPFFTALVIGHHIGALGLSLPLLLPLLAAGAPGEVLMSLVFLSSLMGYVVSPLHLCQIVTVDYFNIPLTAVFYRLLLLSLGVLVPSMIIALVV